MTQNKNLASAVATAGMITVRILGIKVEQQSLHRKNPDIACQASTVRNYFCGYKYLVTLPWRNDLPDTMQKNIYQWLDENSVTEFAHNILCVRPGFIKDNDYTIDILGSDLWFWAFKNERDAMLFALRW